MTSSYYQPLRHDVVAKIICNKILWNENLNKKKLVNKETKFTTTVTDKELPWIVPAKTLSKVPHNQPDMIVVNMIKKPC